MRLSGPATRPNLYVFVPALWGLNAIRKSPTIPAPKTHQMVLTEAMPSAMIAFTFWLRNSMESRHLTKSIGTFWVRRMYHWRLAGIALTRP